VRWFGAVLVAKDSVAGADHLGMDGSPVPIEHFGGGEVADSSEVRSTAAGSGRCLVGDSREKSPERQGRREREGAKGGERQRDRDR
jgi:hypothetical protein